MTIQLHGRLIPILTCLVLAGGIAASLLIYERKQALRQELLQLQAQQAELLAAEQDLAGILQEELKRHEALAAEMQGLLTQINDLETEIATASDMLDPVKLRQVAVAELQAEKENVLTEIERLYPLEPANLSNRLLTQDIDRDIQTIETEARFGIYLDQLGISGTRRSGVVNAIASARVESGINGARFTRGDISREEFRVLSVMDLDVLESFLAEDEKSAMPQIRADHAKVRMRNEAAVQIGIMTRSGPRISVPSSYKFGEAYAEEKIRLRQQYSGASVEQQVLSLTALRKQLESVIPAHEMVFVDTFLANEISELQMSQRQEGIR